ncbi:MAG: exodeoxyribonuclease VII large subunit [Anaerolineaceae bacterium]|nr:MAG: exodeoxyribonuclease VII large subunit [Anaerolineaceae bacterium]
MFDDLFKPHGLSVTDVTRHITALLNADDILSDVWVTGEISNMTRASSGHWYFTLKDANAQLRCVMWRSAASRQQTTPKDGDSVEVHGKVQVYAARGEYQLYADALRPVGMGDLYQQFERLKAKLQGEGLFDADRKREHPAFPHQIGVVTSPTAAAFQDIQNVLRRRFPLARVILSPTPVQGTTAPPQIVRAIQRLNDHSAVDVILLCRGGGSIEDLWAFNDEAVARAVAASRIPIITGVGHETDFTIVDFVADLRAPTPSAAAEMATPDIAELRQMVDDRDALMAASMDDRIAAGQRELDALRRDLTRRSPTESIAAYRGQVADLDRRLSRQQTALIAQKRERLAAQSRALHSANPRSILARGYAIVTRSGDGVRVVDTMDVKVGDAITIQLNDGDLKARVEDEDDHERYQRKLF